MRLHLFLATVSLGAVLALAACKGSDEAAGPPPAPEPAPPRADWPAEGAAPALKLLEPGAAPRASWALQPAVGATQPLRVRVAQSAAPKVEGRRTPGASVPHEVDLEVAVTAVEGDLVRAVATVKAARLDLPPDGPPNLMALSLRPLLQRLTGVAAQLTLDRRGVVHAASFAAGGAKDPRLAQMLDAVAGSLEALAVPFPAEAVGVGAVWEVRATRRVGGVRAYVLDRYTLAGVDGEVRQVKVDRTVSADPQVAELPGLPPGATVTLEGLRLDLTGTLTVGPGQLLAGQGGLAGQGEETLVATREGAADRRVLVLATDLRLEDPAAPRGLDAPGPHGGHGHAHGPGDGHDHP